MNIKQIQANLSLKGFGQLEIDGDYGPMTRKSVKDCQIANGLPGNGLVGPETLKVILSPITNNLRKRAVQIMVDHDGVRETKNNSGPKVDLYLDSVGLAPGHSWCMAFIYYCFRLAASEYGVNNPMYKTGHCVTQWNKTPENLRHDSPQSGDVAILRLEGISGHTWAVISVVNGRQWTVEGNTNDNGSANGDGVYIRNRKADRTDKYIRYDQ